MEEILNSRMFRRKLQYLVKWKGYGIEGNTCQEYSENLAHAPEKVTEFHTRNPGAPRRIRALTFGSIPFRPIPLSSASSQCSSRGGVIVRGTPYASGSCLPSASTSAPAPATSSLFCNVFGQMTSYATRSQPPSAPDRMMSRDVARCRKTHRPDLTSRPNPTSLPTCLPSMTR